MNIFLQIFIYSLREIYWPHTGYFIFPISILFIFIIDKLITHSFLRTQVSIRAPVRITQRSPTTYLTVLLPQFQVLKQLYNMLSGFTNTCEVQKARQRAALYSDIVKQCKELQLTIAQISVIFLKIRHVLGIGYL